MSYCDVRSKGIKATRTRTCKKVKGGKGKCWGKKDREEIAAKEKG